VPWVARCTDAPELSFYLYLPDSVLHRWKLSVINCPSCHPTDSVEAISNEGNHEYITQWLILSCELILQSPCAAVVMIAGCVP